MSERYGDVCILCCAVILYELCRRTWLPILSPAHLPQNPQGNTLVSIFKIHKTYLVWISKFPWREHWRCFRLPNAVNIKQVCKSSHSVWKNKNKRNWNNIKKNILLTRWSRRSVVIRRGTSEEQHSNNCLQRYIHLILHVKLSYNNGGIM